MTEQLNWTELMCITSSQIFHYLLVRIANTHKILTLYARCPFKYINSFCSCNNLMRNFYPHFEDEETEAQKGLTDLPELTCWVRSPLVAQTVKNLPAMQETWVWSLGWEGPLEKGMATHFSILAWKISWTEEPGKLESMGSQRVGHNWSTKTITTCWVIWLQSSHSYSLITGKISNVTIITKEVCSRSDIF